MNAIDVFPTKIFEHKINEIDSFNLLDEINKKESEFKIISQVRQSQSIEQYITDFPSGGRCKSVKLKNLDKIFQDIKTEFETFNTDFKVKYYWTAIYIGTAVHFDHIHKINILDDCNYSGIIYLTDLGGTNFYSVSPCSFDCEFYSESKMGKVLIFPSTLPHFVQPTFNYENKRVVVSFNCRITNK